MGKSGWLEMDVQQSGREGWKYASMISGGLCVMTTGMILMPEWYADNWDIHQTVSHH